MEKINNKSILTNLSKSNHVILQNEANYETNIATIKIASCGVYISNCEEAIIKISRDSPAYGEFIRDNITIFNLSKNDSFYNNVKQQQNNNDDDDRWLSISKIKYYNWHISAPESLAKELGFTRLEKIEVWPKYDWEYYRFIEYRRIKTIWVWTDEEREKCILAELDENNKPIKNFERHTSSVEADPYPKGKKKLRSRLVIKSDSDEEN